MRQKMGKCPKVLRAKILLKTELSTVTGEKRHHHCLFTIGEEIEIYQKALAGESYRKIAKQYEVSKSLIGKIVTIYRNLIRHP